MNHLTDEQLQDYLDGNTDKNSTVNVHLDSCPQCQKALHDYRALFTGLDTEPAFPLSADFADSVMDRLPDIEFVPAEETSPVHDRIVLFAGIALMLAAGIYFLDIGSLLQPLFGWAKTQDAHAVQTLHSLKEQASGRGNLLMLITMTLLSIACIAGIDKLIKSRREHTGFRTFVA